MKKLDIKSQKTLYAGGISAALAGVLLKGINIFVDLGRYFGSSIRRLATKNVCK
jgi:hypothetical protein